METIEATYRVTTPMFLGGADPQQAELRLASFKGVLRFWWRASVWPRIAVQGGSVKDLHRKEAELFGSSDEQVGQSKVSLRLRLDSGTPGLVPRDMQLKDGNSVVGLGARYLGYGVMEAFSSTKKNTREGQLTRGCLWPSFSFRVSMVVKAALGEAQRREILLALKLLGLLGSLGSKARKGYGSLTLARLAVSDKEIWSPPSTSEQVRAVLGTLRREALGDGGASSSRPFTSADPPFTALSAQTQILVVPARELRTTPLALLDHLGREMIRYRSWGRNGTILGRENVESEKLFKRDHNLMKQPVRERSRHPERIAFGLPHNYGREPDKQVNPADKGLDRRASPLWLHIHQASENVSPLAVLCFMPATFLPQGSSDISVGGNHVPLETANLWKPIEGLLDRFLKQHTKEPFGEALEVQHG